MSLCYQLLLPEGDPVSVYRLVAELQQLVSQSVGVSDEFLQGLFETDGFLKDLITAIHTHGVRRLKNKKHSQEAI